MDAQIEKIAKSLYFSYRQTDIGLFYGKMGYCLFFFIILMLPNREFLENLPKSCWMK